MLRKKLEELKVDEQTFFRIAHVYFFGTDPAGICTDVAQYRIHAIIPTYVTRYLDTIGAAVS